MRARHHPVHTQAWKPWLKWRMTASTLDYQYYQIQLIRLSACCSEENLSNLRSVPQGASHKFSIMIDSNLLYSYVTQCSLRTKLKEYARKRSTNLGPYYVTTAVTSVVLHNIDRNHFVRSSSMHFSTWKACYTSEYIYICDTRQSRNKGNPVLSLYNAHKQYYIYITYIVYI